MENKKEQFVRICPSCGGTDIMFSPLISSGFWYHCKKCDFHSVFFPEVKKSKIDNFRKEVGTKKQMPEIFVFTGNGGGKTLAAFGLTLRMLGHGKKAVIIQFMKGRKDIGEYKSCKKFGLEIHQFGRKGFVNPKKPAKEDIELANRALKFSEKIIKTKKINLLVLDEINIAVKFKLLKTKDVVNFLKKCPKDLLVILTGRYAPKKFLRIADLVIEFRNIKEPKALKPARKGIEY